MTKYKYTLKDLDCANCAREIEEHLEKDKNLNNVIVNYSKLSLSFETEIKDVKNYVSKKVNEVEPEVTLLDTEEDNDTKKEIINDSIKLVIGIILTLIGTLCNFGIITKIIVILAYVILLYEIFIKAVKLLFKSFTINENLLITISCIGAYFTGNIAEGLMVIILYQIGEILEHLAVNNSRKSIANLMDIKPVYANLKVKNEIKEVDPTEVSIGDTIVIRKGERIPLDGIIIKGETSLDTSALNGESKSRYVKIKDEVLSGSINLDDVIEIKVTTKY
ncbi:MAG: heavy metal translocating P-type ATPase, partial [Bacilli bacterium]|nr:heavy metal translocating P-type ATPase [Bacilli bacterium]